MENSASASQKLDATEDRNSAISTANSSFMTHPTVGCKRVFIEIKKLTEDVDNRSCFRYEKLEHDEIRKTFCIYGFILPREEPYKRGSYQVRISLPPEYPFKGPTLDLLTYIYHPTVEDDESMPRLCPCCFEFQHTPRSSIIEFIEHYVNGIDKPDLLAQACQYNPEARMLYDTNKEEYNRKALAMVQKHAHPR